jgi:catechol 2,3-dioxygenase-like lactoylglutathione lyase family enzyme
MGVSTDRRLLAGSRYGNSGPSRNAPETGPSFARVRLSLFPQPAMERSWKGCRQNHGHSSSPAVAPARTHRLHSMPTPCASDYTSVGPKETLLDKATHSRVDHMAIQRMDNVLIVVDDLEAAKSFFIELGLELEGETQVEGPSVGSLIGLKDVRATLALMRTPDGHGSIELDKFHTPSAVRFGPVDAPVNALGIRRIMFAVEDIDAVVARLLAHGAELIGEVVQYEDTNRLAYIRGPEGIIVGLNEQIG